MPQKPPQQQYLVIIRHKLKVKKEEKVLEEITINNLGLITQTKINFHKGLTILTGETGSGKTMVINGLELLLGGRSKQSLLTNNTLILNGIFSKLDKNTKKLLNDHNIDTTEEELIATRTITNDGKSRLSFNNSITPLKNAKNITSNLISIHGQSEQILLKNTSKQYERLDSHLKQNDPNFSKLLKTYQTHYREWKKLRKQLADTKQNYLLIKAEKHELQKLINKMNELEPENNEIETLTQSIKKLENFDYLREIFQNLYNLYDSSNYENKTEELYNETINLLDKATSIDETISPIFELAKELENKHQELQSHIEEYNETIDNETLEELYNNQERLRSLKNLEKNYGASLDELISTRSEKESRLAELESEDNSIENIEYRLAESFKKVKSTASELTQLRIANAKNFSKQVNKELQELNMKGSEFLIIVNEKEGFDSNGNNEVVFSLKNTITKETRPISDSASGGELSRIMLAIELALNTNNSSTLIFDEIDSGVGGETATRIGEKLYKLSQNNQVIVITHLPQVACFADSHLQIIKTVTNKEIATTVEQLTEETRVNELSRMMSGLSNSKTGSAHVMELLTTAQEYKNTLTI